MADPFHLDRFTDAQAPVIEQVLRELRGGRKTSHWMWFVFPQLAGLGFSAMAQRYAIASRAEAEAYRAHPVLGPRLVECTLLVNHAPGRSATAILGTPDDMKFHSCVTLFAAIDPAEPAFGAALGRFFGGQPNSATLRLLATPA